MKLLDIRNEYYEATSKLSDINRQIAFAGIATVWIFIKPTELIFNISCFLLYALLSFVSSLTFDLLQYIYKSILFYYLHSSNEKKAFKIADDSPEARDEIHDSQSFDYKSGYNFLANVFMWTKIAACMSGYICMIIFLLQYKT